VVSDLLGEEDWDQGYHSAEKLEGLKNGFEVALDSIHAGGTAQGRCS
jgi:hypothetical protein